MNPGLRPRSRSRASTPTPPLARTSPPTTPTPTPWPSSARRAPWSSPRPPPCYRYKATGRGSCLRHLDNFQAPRNALGCFLFNVRHRPCVSRGMASRSATRSAKGRRELITVHRPYYVICVKCRCWPVRILRTRSKAASLNPEPPGKGTVPYLLWGTKS